MTALPPKALLLIPALNEEAAIARVIGEAKSLYPALDVLVVDDCSSDATPIVARQAGAQVLSLPCHLGLGGAVQAGYKLAFELGYHHVVRIDGDGQHNPADIPRLFAALRQSEAEMAIGIRSAESPGFTTTFARRMGIAFFKLLLRPILGRKVSDPTSGFVAVGPRALALFGRTFPLEYPEIEALVVLQRRRFRFEEVPCQMRARLAGKSTITTVKSIYFVIHVLLGVFVNILRIDGSARKSQEQEGR